MGIREIIERKKQQFFVARDSDKLELQRQALTKEREKLIAERTQVAKVRKLQDDISKERNDINSMRTAKARSSLQKIGGGLRNLNENVKKFSNDADKNSVVNTVKSFDSGNSEAFRNTLQFDNSKSPFAISNKMNTNPAQRQVKKVVTIYK